MIQNTVEIIGAINFDPIHFLVKNKDGKESLLIYVYLLEDAEKEKYMSIPAYIRRGDLIDYVKSNEYIDGHKIRLKGRLECIVSNIKRASGHTRECYVVVDNPDHCLQHLQN